MITEIIVILKLLLFPLPSAFSVLTYNVFLMFWSLM